MSRGVRDLRDLICVSRLSVRDSDDEDEDKFTDSDTSGDRNNTDDDQNQSSFSHQSSGSDHCSPSSHTVDAIDSGIGTSSGPSPSADDNPSGSGDHLPIKTISTKQSTFIKKSKTNVTKASSKKKRGPLVCREPGIASVPEFKCEVLPPIFIHAGKLGGGKSSSKLGSYDAEASGSSSKSSSNVSQEPPSTNFDAMMVYIDTDVVTDWLTRANTVLQEVTVWVHKGENFVAFAQFWLKDMSEQQKADIFQLEYSVLIDEIGLAFKSGRDTGAITQKDLLSLAKAIIREFPDKLLGHRGPFLFLNILDTLTSERTDDYRKLLTDVKLATKNRTYAQWILAARSFGLVNIWSAVLNFYRELVYRGEVKQPVARPSTAAGRRSTSGKTTARGKPQLNDWQLRTVQTINVQYLDVLNYIIMAKKIDSGSFKDFENRNLIFLAVSLQQKEVLLYLIKEVFPFLDVNARSETGNTPLHSAVSSANLDLVQMLVDVGKALVNPVNSQCDDSTPLHMAVMFGHELIVKYLLEKGGDPLLKTSGSNCLDLAKAFDQTLIHDMISQRLNDKT